jgi:diguanylate cyclase (GGDEF)-like protein
VLLLDAIRTQAAPYLHTAILHGKLRDLAAIDDLTQLLNRRFGMRRLGEEFSRAARHGVPVSVFMVDIDHFKQFNDAYGHDAGDAVLMAVARVLDGSGRAGDIVCRYGGEELMVVAPGTGMNDAAAAAERMRRLVEATPIVWRDKALNVTVSVGTATWPVVRASFPEEMVTYADAALYHAKRSGRNRVSVHQGKEVRPNAVTEAAVEQPASDDGRRPEAD